MNDEGAGADLQDVLGAFGAAGYDMDLGVDRDGVRCPACGNVSPARRFGLVELQRATDGRRGERVVVVAVVECPECATRGRLVLDDADEAHASVLQALGSTA